MRPSTGARTISSLDKVEHSHDALPTSSSRHIRSTMGSKKHIKIEVNMALHKHRLKVLVLNISLTAYSRELCYTVYYTAFPL